MKSLLERSNDFAEVKLVWDENTNQIFITIQEGEGEDIMVQQVPSDKGMDAFNHPYIYMTEPEYISTVSQSSESLVERIEQYVE